MTTDRVTVAVPAQRHVVRPVPPWRDPERTECGLLLIDGVALIGRDELPTGGAAYDAVRGVCRTCWVLAERWPGTWETDPVEVMRRCCADATSLRPWLDSDLRALATLAAAYRVEFARIRTSADQVTSLDVVRRRRMRNNPTVTHR